MQPYTPFARPLRDLEVGDLKALKEASEGWYIEYKRESPKAAAVAKSLSAFANTYGGWLFIGVQEASKESPFAGSFPGVYRTDVDASIQRLRKAAADHLNPTPHFEIRVLWGPDPELELAEDHAIICIWTPQSNSAPHVHKSGHIYRRVADASEPKPETDRFILDQLWRRADDIKRIHQEWFDNDPEFSESEKACPYLRLMLIADPRIERDVWLDVDETEVRRVLTQTDGVSSIPFDTVHTTSTGFVGRQLTNNSPHHLTLTWRLRRDMVSDIIIPLPLLQPHQLDELSIDLRAYANTAKFIDLLARYNSEVVRVVDLNYLFNILIGIAEIQAGLCSLAGWTESYYAKTKLLNCWRMIPFLDDEFVLSHFEKHGISMCLDSISSFPPFNGPEGYLEVSPDKFRDSNFARALFQGVMMFTQVAISFGIPAWPAESEDESDTPYYERLLQAGRRAIDNQDQRNSRLRRLRR
ncbi:MAG: helix-turn-helix domain-containing protein [Cyanobium sp.]